jgi:hypothetical protein
MRDQNLLSLGQNRLPPTGRRGTNDDFKIFTKKPKKYTVILATGVAALIWRQYKLVFQFSIWIVCFER